MATLEFEGKSYEVDEEGYLMDYRMGRRYSQRNGERGRTRIN